MILTADLRMFRHSGIGRYLRNLLPLLLPQLQADEIHILAPHALLGNAPWLADPRIRLHETHAPIYSIAEQRLLTAVPSHHLLWVPHFNAPLYRRGPLAVTIHDIAPLALPQILPNPIKRAYADLLIHRAVAQASTIFTVSNFTRTELITRLHVPAEKITVTPLALDTEWPHTVPPHLEADATPYLLFVGNVKPNKNLTLLLTAFASIAGKLPYRLLIAGKHHGHGTTDDAVFHQARSLGDRVRFTGELSDSDLQRLYAGAAALVLPSFYEGFGLPLLEAMSLGCPVLSSTAGSLPEVAGNAALYFNPHDPTALANHLLRLQDTALIDPLRAAGRTRVTEFSWPGCANQTAAVLNQSLISHL
jgi:glycosyltransferase involved in cell wall biosynthesis